MNPSDFTGGGSACQYQGSACGSCWALTGPGGTANIQVTDCCAGYPGNPSCLTSNDPSCDWCAANDNQHFDLDWDSYATLCGGQVDAGHCTLSSAVSVSCPAQAVGDPSNTFGSTDTSAASVPAWGVAMLVLASLMIVILVVVIVILARQRSEIDRT